MNEFYIGLHQPSDAWPFLNSIISVNRLVRRKSGFRVNNWILDSGSFSQIEKFGHHTLTPKEYLRHVNWFSAFGSMRAAVCQDWMCESHIIAITGLSVVEHQARTIQSYHELRSETSVTILPVLQGFRPEEYVDHVRHYGNLLAKNAWVGVGSVCRRNGNPDAAEDVLLAIKSERGDLRLHGFGLKLQAIERPTVRELLYSSDSMAWSEGSRYREKNQNDPRKALKYAARVEEMIKHPCLIQKQLFEWWS